MKKQLDGKDTVAHIFEVSPITGGALLPLTSVNLVHNAAISRYDAAVDSSAR